MYDPQAIEARRQNAWRAREEFATPVPSEDRPRKYIKPSAPFTSGNIHIGHVRSYSIGDAYARFCRARGEDVLFAFGYDAFGLPAELGAISSGEPPAEWVSRCAEHMTGQLERLGFSFDWERSFLSSDVLFYRWSQWLFLTLLDAGLVYRGTGTVDWCEHCQTTLASIQVEDGRCWRCHEPVRLVQQPQWFWRISAYVPENDRRLRELAESGIWDDVALASQRYVLGRVDGVELTMADADGEELGVFTPHADALAGARFVLMSARHSDADAWAADPAASEELQALRAGGWERSEREADTVPVIDTGRTLAWPGGEPLPVYISPLVDSRFGATVALGIPDADRSDEAIARRMGLEPDAVASAAAPAAPIAPTAPTGVRPAVRYKAFDWVISRQRAWGTPIPIVYCERCGVVPVPREQLPVLLPLDLVPTGAGNPLAEREDFVQVACPTCGGRARRETDTLDCHFDALWLWVPACVPPAERERPLEEIFALQDLRAWLPSERVVAGSDSGSFVFDQRIVTKALRDIGPLAFLADGEPFAGCLFHEMVIRDGRKMSKHLGNVVDPDELVERFGADTVRLALLYAARPQKQLNWSDSAVLHCHRFLKGVWEFSLAHFAASGQAPDADVAGAGGANADGAGAEGAVADVDGAGRGEASVRDTSEHLRRRLAKWCETAVEKITADMEALEMHSAVRNVMRLFERVRDFEKRVLARQAELGEADREALVQALVLIMRLLAPFAPHVAEELLLAAGHDERETAWPRVSFQVPA
jgi:leucyl-tRNA synthetase